MCQERLVGDKYFGDFSVQTVPIVDITTGEERDA
jgi:hypothetical protein